MHHFESDQCIFPLYQSGGLRAQFKCYWWECFSILHLDGLLFVSVSFCLHFDCLLNSELHCTFNSACSVIMVFTQFSSHLSSVISLPVRILLRKVVNFRWLPALCWTAISKCSNRPSHRVNPNLYWWLLCSVNFVVPK